MDQQTQPVARMSGAQSALPWPDHALPPLLVELRRTRSADTRLRVSAYRSPVPWQRWHFTTLSPFLTKPLPSQFLHLAFFLMFGPFSLAMMVSKVRFVRWIATEGCALSW